MTDTINIFGKVHDAINESMQKGDGQNFAFHNIEKHEAMAISSLILMAFLNLLRDLTERSRVGTLTDDDIPFLNQLISAINGKNHGDANKLFNYNDETRIIFVSLPAERIDMLNSHINKLHDYLNLIKDCSTQRIDLPKHGNPISYAFHCPDITDTIGDKVFTKSLYNFIGSLLLAHGFTNAAAIDLKQNPPMIAVKKTALDAVLRLERLELQTQRDGSGEFPSH